jgi:hypothetical protein
MADAGAVAPGDRRARFASDEAPTDTKSLQAFVQGAIGEVTELVHFCAAARLPRGDRRR